MLRQIAYQLGRAFGALGKPTTARPSPIEVASEEREAPAPKLQQPERATRSFHSKLAGVTAKNTNGRSRQDYILAFCKPRIPLKLVRESENKFDKNAIAVFVAVRTLGVFSGEVQIGYLGAALAGELAPLIDGGTPVRAEISEVTGGGTKNLGVNILVTRG